MVQLNSIVIEPELINTSCAWASDYSQLKDLYECTFTGAVTTRTATPGGFREDERHTVAFSSKTTSSINSYGYSPHPLSSYLEWIKQIFESDHSKKFKPFIISITASNSSDLERMVADIQTFRAAIGDDTSTPSRIAIELNTSCPNIPGSPPSAYSPLSEGGLRELLAVLSDAHANDRTLTIGLKLPPFVYRQQFVDLITLLKQFSYSQPDSRPFPFAFLTCTNTLGNSLFFSESMENASSSEFALPTGTGGLAGEALHPLALGNVYTFSNLLRTEKELKDIAVIGVGGVTDRQGVRRMQKAGATVVGCATMLGIHGVKAFEILTVRSPCESIFT
ncbi:dihydroorotate dehydrogenase [Paramarasmius palmivorus]|uniref:Dihydroorotate oxidase n=1 Tax=Paramarasmius palmivorus TaxID=297713 RepID=A0AAW0CL59_9AGAR